MIRELIRVLQILRDVGSLAYKRAVAFMEGPDYKSFHVLQDEIQRHFLGPDSYYQDPSAEGNMGSANFFGNAWWIPFPPSLVRSPQLNSAFVANR
jgi:hypothetical protein